MAGWRKHFTVYDTKQLDNVTSHPFGLKGDSVSSGTARQSWLPEVYAGASDRVQRYHQYNIMDQDSDINASLDILAEFCSETEDGAVFEIKWNKSEGEPGESEVDALETLVNRWTSLNDFNTRLFKTVRNTLKYGDQIYIRDPETYKLYWIDPANIEKIVVNEADGKKPFEYHIRDLDLNLQTLAATDSAAGTTEKPIRDPLEMTARTSNGPLTQLGIMQAAVSIVPAEHIVHISLASEDSATWPFGTSLLESVFKVYKQKEMLEDSVLIYRVQRAPERRAFYIDVGDMPRPRAMQYLEQVKNEINQKRIPSKSSGGDSIVDATYNPMSMMEDYFFAQTSDSKGSKVEVLPGGSNLGEIDDLKYFSDMMQRALRIPAGYLPKGDDNGGGSYNDGKIGTAFISEYRFTKYCKRLQTFVQQQLDREFKMFVKNRGVTIDSSTFELVMNEPQNFAKYRQIEIDSQQINAFNQINDNAFVSTRFAAKRYLGWTEQEIQENEQMLMEERQPKKGKKDSEASSGGGDFGGPSMGTGAIGDFEADDFGDEFDDMEAGDETDMDVGSDSDEDMPEPPAE